MKHPPALNDCRVCGNPVRVIDARAVDREWKPEPAPPDETEAEKRVRLIPHKLHLRCVPPEWGLE